MIPSGMRETVMPTVNRFLGTLSEQLKRFAVAGPGVAAAAAAASNSQGPLTRPMPAFSSVLEEEEVKEEVAVAAPKEIADAPRGVPVEPIVAVAAPKEIAEAPRSAAAESVFALASVSGGQAPAGAGAERWVEHTIRPGDTLWALATKKYHVDVEDLMRDNGIQDPRNVRVGQKIRVRIPAQPKAQPVVASWYGHDHHGKLMANGERFNMHSNTIAHKQLPFGTRVELENPTTGQKVTAVVADRGPFIEGRDVDLSYGLAQKLTMVEKGVGPLVMRVMG
jgi:rare lipoprotein A